jgi:hypothetical protein
MTFPMNLLFRDTVVSVVSVEESAPRAWIALWDMFDAMTRERHSADRARIAVGDMICPFGGTFGSDAMFGFWFTALTAWVSVWSVFWSETFAFAVVPVVIVRETTFRARVSLRNVIHTVAGKRQSASRARIAFGKMIGPMRWHGKMPNS